MTTSLDTHRNHDLLINKTPNLLDLPENDIRQHFFALARISAACLADSLKYYSDSTVDDVIILTEVLNSSLRIATDDYGTSSRSLTQHLNTALNDGLLDNLIHLKIANNSFDAAILNQAPIWAFLNEPTDEMLDNADFS